VWAFAVLVCCFFLVLLLPVILFVLTYIYRQACVLSGLPKPSLMTASGMTLVRFVSLLVAEAIVGKIVEYCLVDLGGLPRWEAGVVFFFLFFPVDLLICATIEAGLMGLKVGKAIEVWFVHRLILLCLVVAGAFIALIVFLIRTN
jgi:hypothetical protein